MVTGVKAEGVGTGTDAERMRGLSPDLYSHCEVRVGKRS